MMACSSPSELHELPLQFSVVNLPHQASTALIKMPKALMESCHPFQHALTETAILPHVNVSTANHLKTGYHFRSVARNSGSFPQSYSSLLLLC